MSAPIPVAGPNPYVKIYQKRQFHTGVPGESASILDDLATKPAGADAAKAASDPLVERAENIAHPQHGINPTV